MVYERDDMEGLDSSLILGYRLVWKYSGHEDTFSDPLIDCRKCNSRYRADKSGRRNFGRRWRVKSQFGKYWEMSKLWRFGLDRTSPFQSHVSHSCGSNV